MYYRYYIKKQLFPATTAIYNVCICIQLLFFWSISCHKTFPLENKDIYKWPQTFEHECIFMLRCWKI